MPIIKALEALGYRTSEAKIYQEILGSEESTLATICEKVKLPRSTVQEAVLKLQKKGVLKCYLKKRRKYWVAESPEVFLKELREKTTAFEDALPKLTNIKKSGNTDPKIRLFSGVEEIKLLYEDILKTKSHIYMVIDWDGLTELFGNDGGTIMLEEFKKKFLKAHILTRPTELAQGLKAMQMDSGHKIRFFPANIIVKNAYILYKDKFVILIFNSKMPLGVLLEHAETVNSFQNFFNILWDVSSPK